MESKIEVTGKRDLEVDLSIIKSNDRPSLDFTAVCINSSSTFDDSDAVTYTIAYSTSYCYDRENKNLLVTTDSDGTIVKYVYGNGLIASYETVADTTEYQSYSYDIRGSVTRISDENGSATSEYLYSTYGQRTVLYGTGASILGYCGRDGVLTDATGLLYMRARYYSTELMRFINEDIIVGDISNSGSLNRYTYVEGNPVTNVDPFGLCAERIENGIWGLFNCAKGGGMAVCGTLAVITGVATIAAGGPFIAMLLAAGAIGAGAYEAICGTADFTEGLQQLYSAVTGKENSAFNFVRDTIFKDNVDEYYLSEALAAGIASNCVGMLSAFQAVASDSTNSEGSTGSDLDGVRIINKKYAGKTFELSGDLGEKYPKGVNFSNEGFPEFESYSIKKVTINNLEGDAYYDFIKANEDAGYSSTPTGYTWHHVEDGKTMLLVPSDLHGAVRHTGGASLIRKGIRP